MPMMPIDPANAGEQRTALLGPQIVEAQRDGRGERHRGLAQPLVYGRLRRALLDLVRVGIAADHAVAQLDGSGGVLLGELGIMCDHDHQTVLRHLLEQVHDLHGRVGVERSGRLVGQHDVRVVDQGAGDGDALHLPAGQLVRLLVDVVAQPDLFEGLAGTLPPFGTGYAGDRQRELHVRQNRLVRNQVVALEHEADRVVAVRIPVTVLVPFGGDPVDDQVAAVVPVQAADDVEQRGLAGTRWAQYRHEFAVAQVQADVIQRLLHEIAGLVLLGNRLNLQHDAPLITHGWFVVCLHDLRYDTTVSDPFPQRLVIHRKHGE